MKVKQALELLRKCEESDFNVINVSNAIASALIKLGQYDEAKIYVEKALTYNNKDSGALYNKSVLTEYGFSHKSKKVYKAVAILGVLLIFLYAGLEYSDVLIRNNQEKSKNVDIIEKQEKNEEVPPAPIEKTEIAIKEDQKEEEALKKDVFPLEELKTAVDNLDYNKLDEIYDKFKDAELSINEKSILSKSHNILKTSAVEYFYAIAREALSQDDTSKAIEYFEKGKKYGGESYFFQHVIYFLATTYERVGNIEKAIIHYELYYSKYQQGNYSDSVLYSLALIYNNLDKEKAKFYGNELRRLYNSSIYNNSKIDDILR